MGGCYFVYVKAFCVIVKSKRACVNVCECVLMRVGAWVCVWICSDVCECVNACVIECRSV